MDIAKEIINNHPWVGGLISLVGAALPFVSWITPYLQLSGLVIGLLVGILTLLNLIEQRIKRYKRHQKYLGKHKHLK